MPSRRVLFLGPTGVDKSTVLTRLLDFAGREFARDCVKIDFEKDFLSSQISLAQYLDQPVATQHERWRKAWTAFFNENEAVTSESYQGPDAFLALHGCFTRGHYGTRLVADPSEVARFRPHLIVTLIDDIYDLWWRTEARAGGDPWKGRPTLEQLALARRVEAAFGDLVMCLADTNPRHLLIAAAHPQRTVAQAIYGNDPKVIYLSFPITEPGHMATNGDNSGIKEIDDFIRRTAECERQNRSVSFVCPLAIDELPFVRFGMTEDNRDKVKHIVGGGRSVEKDGFVFPRDDERWHIDSFWQPEECMKVPPAPGQPFLCEQLEAACGNIRTDVGWRDYRLAEQADKLFVFNPVMNGADRRKREKPGLARGVTAEIFFALALGVPVYVFQDKRHDPNKEWAAWYDTTQGGVSMGPAQTGSRLLWVDSLDDLFDNLGR